MRYPLSVLDLIPVAEGTTASSASRASLELAQLAESLGYVRYWISEHHGMACIASPAPEILLTRIGALTEHIRIGSGGMMLPNHRPLKLAEMFHALEALYPGRVDLGVGRAPGSDPRASRALGAESPERFGELLNHMLALSRGELPRTHPVAGVTVMPDDVGLPPIWILGSSGASAAAAGNAGMGYGFASHFSPTPPAPAMERYRGSFRSTGAFSEPHAILAISVVCAETDEQAEYLAASVDLTTLRIENNDFRPLVRPEDAQAHEYSERERRAIAANRARYVVGGPERVCERIHTMAEEAGADEIMLVCNIPDHTARLDAYRLIAEHYRG